VSTALVPFLHVVLLMLRCTALPIKAATLTRVQSLARMLRQACTDWRGGGSCSHRFHWGRQVSR
jgi:hypothetical protein